MDLLHRIRNAEHDAFGILDDDARQRIEAKLDDARDHRNDGDPDMSEAWDCLFEAESMIDSIRQGAQPTTTFGGAA